MKQTQKGGGETSKIKLASPRRRSTSRTDPVPMERNDKEQMAFPEDVMRRACRKNAKARLDAGLLHERFAGRACH
jgi:hypothetical protein